MTLPYPGHFRAETAALPDENRLSKMISTVDVNNGFREELLPMALTSSTSAANGLRNSMLALAALHQWGAREALPYKAKALGSLSSSLSTESVGITQTQLATSMMLCVYNVRRADVPTLRQFADWHRSLTKLKAIGVSTSTGQRIYSMNSPACTTASPVIASCIRGFSTTRF